MTNQNIPKDMCFVFGSNEAGLHGAGAARFAFKNHGARMGQGFGFHGNSFAIPTKDWLINSLDYETIKNYVDRFIVYARQNPDKNFKLTRIGCGLAGLNPKTMALMFKNAPDNVWIDSEWNVYLNRTNVWGTA